MVPSRDPRRLTILLLLNWGLLAVVLVLVGCSPAGPRALLDGEQLLHEGKIDLAVARLRTATELISTNAQAWNHLGLALHAAGDGIESQRAYQQALKIDRNLAIVRYNLGFLYLEQNRPAEAAAELTTFTTLQAYSAPGWLQLGIAHMRLRRWDDAERALAMAYRIQANDPEIMNDLGVVLLQKRRQRDAAAWFNAALKARPNHGPALLNSAVVSQYYFNAKELALDRYRQYVALQPEPANASAVREVIARLEAELAPKPLPAQTPNLVPTVVTNTQIARPPTNNIASQPSQPSTPPSVESPGKSPAPIEESPSAERTVARPVARSLPVLPTEAAPQPLQVVQLTDDSTLPPVRDVAPETLAGTNAAAVELPKVTEAKVDAPPSALIKPAQRESKSSSFWQKANPLGWFGSKNDEKEPNKNVPAVAPRKPVEKLVLVSTNAPKTTPPAAVIERPVFPKYTYLQPAKPSVGKKAEGEVLFKQAFEAHQAGRIAEAISGYLAATHANPAHFEATYNLNLAAYQNRDWSLATQAGEAAMAIQPNSTDARYNFAMSLEAAGYLPDAAEELEKIIAIAPADIRSHLALAQIATRDLKDDRRAMLHYKMVLEQAPDHPQAEAIRRWLLNH